MEETSLDDFLDAGAESPESPNEGASDAGADGVEPATTTFAWSLEGEGCAACGREVRGRWDDERGLVCAECKGWSDPDR